MLVSEERRTSTARLHLRWLRRAAGRIGWRGEGWTELRSWARAKLMEQPRFWLGAAWQLAGREAVEAKSSKERVQTYPTFPKARCCSELAGFWWAMLRGEAGKWCSSCFFAMTEKRVFVASSVFPPRAWPGQYGTWVLGYLDLIDNRSGLLPTLLLTLPSP